eukprot:TRINITY_DN7397_c0_g5_i1.p1 TRINITY_DN7397_c0_g5~~TRINITY_DN7397_c0_g5_i1.p1  ORF type:complete len:450 (-),score=54.39 TRINITY_DN7397_c0_g5_i1:112-1461(-)
MSNTNEEIGGFEDDDEEEDADEGGAENANDNSSEIKYFNANSPNIRRLLETVNQVCSETTDDDNKRIALEDLSYALRPQVLRPEAREVFVREATLKGVVNEAVSLVELGNSGVAAAAANFLGDFAFNSDHGAREVLCVFDRIADRFQRIFGSSSTNSSGCLAEDSLLHAAILLCVNIAATCPSGHILLVSLVQPVCLQILQSPEVTDKLRGNTILLLANLSMTVLHELRTLGVADVLLDLIDKKEISDHGKSVAESVIIFLHGEKSCPEVDRLIDRGVVENYIVPIMVKTLNGKAFRGMFPHLLYSARLFQVLCQSREYSEALLENRKVVPLLLKALKPGGPPPRVETDYEGRRLVLEALLSLAEFGLWPEVGDEESEAFLRENLPTLCQDCHPGIRAYAAGIWAHFNKECVLGMMKVGKRLETEGRVPHGLWRCKIAAMLFPTLIVAV